jgi:hypothetical protein
MKPAVKVFGDGREVCQDNAGGRREYYMRLKAMVERQDHECCICRKPMLLSDATFEHQDGRGMNGGHRDDRIEKDGRPYNGAAHRWCNNEKGSKRMIYTRS